MESQDRRDHGPATVPSTTPETGSEVQRECRVDPVTAAHLCLPPPSDTTVGGNDLILQFRPTKVQPPTVWAGSQHSRRRVPGWSLLLSLGTLSLSSLPLLRRTWSWGSGVGTGQRDWGRATARKCPEQLRFPGVFAVGPATFTSGGQQLRHLSLARVWLHGPVQCCLELPRVLVSSWPTGDELWTSVGPSPARYTKKWVWRPEGGEGAGCWIPSVAPRAPLGVSPEQAQV